MITVGLLILLAFWGIFIYLEGKGRARINYLRFQPLIASYTNGTLWLRKYSQSRLSFFKALPVYLMVVVIGVGLSMDVLEGYSSWGYLAIHLSICLLPITLAPFCFDWGYYREFTRLANLPDTSGPLKEHIHIIILQVGKRQTSSLLFMGFLLFFLQTLVFILPLTF